MQHRVAKGYLVALGTVALMGFAVADLDDVEAVFDDPPPAAVASTADSTVPPLAPLELVLVGLQAGVLENDILNRMDSQISTIAPATGEPIVDRILELYQPATILGPLESTSTTESAVFAMTDFGAFGAAGEPVEETKPAVPPPAKAKRPTLLAEESSDGYVVIGSFTVADNAVEHARLHQKWRPLVMSAVVGDREILLVVVGPFLAEDLGHMLQLVVLDGIDDAWLFTPKGESYTG